MDSRSPITEEEENTFLNKINNYIQNKENTFIQENKLQNITINTLINNTLNTLYSIINDISKLQLSEDIDNEWWKKWTKLIEEILYILFQPERAFYIGIILILISVIVYFMDVSSN
jgi:hypothetical protein